MTRKAAGFVLILFLVFPLYAYAGGPFDTVEQNVNNILGVLKDSALQGEEKKQVKIEKMRSISNELFHWRELSKRTLGRNWKKLKKGQKSEFITLFRNILEDAYLNRILEYKDEKIEFLNEKMLTEKKALVETTVITGQTKIPIDYRVILKNDRWGVYDVIIEGVSMVKNYRKQFRELLAKRQPEEFLEILRKKADKA
jgi:phospholipid transport system substrate-binding protein